MEIIPHPNKKFLAKYERFEPAVRDATAMRAFKLCKRKFFYKIVLGFRGGKPSPVLVFGNAYHKFREVLQRTDDKKQALEVALDIWAKANCEQPVGARYDFLTTERLIASCVYAYNYREAERKQGKIKVLATEQNFVVELPNGVKVGGRADEIISWNGRPYGRDFKTTSIMGKYYERKLDPNDQFTRYTYGESKLAGERVWGQFVECLYNTKKEGPVIENFITSRTDYQLLVWEREQMFLEEMITKCREADCWPMEDSDEACPRCEYRNVCTSITEEGIQARLEAGFTQQPWNFNLTDEGQEDGGATT